MKTWIKGQDQRPFFSCIVVLVGVVGTLCFGPSLAAQADPTEPQSAANVEIPFELYNGNVVVTKATIGKMKKMNVILDTGTNPSIVSKEVANRMKLPETAESLETLNGTIQAQSVTVPSLEMGALHADSVRVMVQDLGSVERDLGIALGGIVGLDVLSSGRFTIDYEKRRIVFGSMPATDNVVPFATTTPFLTVSAIADGQQVRLLLDSGTWGLLLFHNRLRASADKIHLDRSASISSAGGATRLGWLRAAVSIGNDSLGSHTIAIADQDPGPGYEFDGLLGFAKMGFHRVSFDFAKGTFGWD
jgi:predicted aspartyl protease